MSSLRIHIPSIAIVKAPGLLPMLYRVSELATEIRIPDRTLRDWLQRGAPFVRDSRNKIWISGREFGQWIAAQRRPARSSKLSDNEALCLRCNTVVEIVAPETFHVRGKLTRTRGTCPVCNCVINRGGRLADMSMQNASVNPLNPVTGA